MSITNGLWHGNGRGSTATSHGGGRPDFTENSSACPLFLTLASVLYTLGYVFICVHLTIIDVDSTAAF
jgi:hypothetical protein